MSVVRQVIHPQLGALALELRVSRLVIWSCWMSAGLFLAWAALMAFLGVATGEPPVVLAALPLALLACPWLLFARWMQRNEIACYEQGVVTRRMFGSRQLRFDQMRSCHSELKERITRSTNGGQPVTHYTRHLHFTSADEDRAPSIHYQTSIYYNDPRLSLILAYCSRQPKADVDAIVASDAGDGVAGGDLAVDGWAAGG